MSGVSLIIKTNINEIRAFIVLHWLFVLILYVRNDLFYLVTNEEFTPFENEAESASETYALKRSSSDSSEKIHKKLRRKKNSIYMQFAVLVWFINQNQELKFVQNGHKLVLF